MDHRSYLFFSVTLSFLAPATVAVLEYFQRQLKAFLRPKPFKLLKLPWVALKEVLRSMEHRDVFMISLCSKTTFDILKIWKTKVNWLYYNDGLRDLSVYSLQSNYHRDLIFSMRITNDIRHSVENEQDLIRLTIGGMDVQCLWKRDGIKYIHTRNIEALQQALDNHIHQLFTVKTIYLELSDTKFWDIHYPNVSKVTDLYISHKLRMSSSQFEAILEKYPNLKSFRMKGHFSDRMTFYPKLSNVEHVRLESNCYFSASYLRENFQGRCIALSGAGIDAIEILDFVNDWILGMKYFNLEVFLMSNIGSKLNTAWIFNALNHLAKEWNRPTVYEYWTRETEIKQNGLEEIDLSGNEYEGFMDFERKTDQKMATLMLSDYKFGFIVWN